MTKPFLVTGATGDTGREVTRLLLEHGHAVRALAHKHDARSEALTALGAEVVTGDLLDLDAVAAAMEGVAGAYFVYPIRPGIIEASAYFAQAAREAEVDAIVNMSQISSRRDSLSAAARNHWIAERVFDWSGVGVTHIRPTFFAEWLLYIAPLIRSGDMVMPLGGPQARHAPIAAEDQAKVIVAILENPAAHRGQIYPLFGPEELTPDQIAEKVSTTLGRPVTYRKAEVKAFVQGFRLARGGDPNAPMDEGLLYLMQHLTEVAKDHANGLFAGHNDVIERLTGSPPLSVEAFVEKNRAAFA
ncbi:NmrA family NAD(P)-binding protein [Phenylobacterium sp.]|uniref:NmrA family NAD(P)-binding protein n=1 Tax=Phenylobacterium sp. TaxID=1871053 RepID=UPI0035AF023D